MIITKLIIKGVHFQNCVCEWIGVCGRVGMRIKFKKTLKINPIKWGKRMKNITHRDKTF